ncbi:MAG: hypothetical protein AAFS12_12265 [Cyanobacteria bacterium J06632_19]
MEPVKKRPIKAKNYISFLYIYSTNWGTAGDLCLIRETVAEASTSKFVGRKVKLSLPRGMEKHKVEGYQVIKVAGHVGEGHPKDPGSEWEAYEGITRETAIVVLRPWGFKLVEPD